MTWFCHYDWKRNYKPHAQGQQIRILPARDVLKVTHPSKLKALWLKGNVPGKRKFTGPLMKEGWQQAVRMRDAGPSPTREPCRLLWGAPLGVRWVYAVSTWYRSPRSQMMPTLSESSSSFGFYLCHTLMLPKLVQIHESLVSASQVMRPQAKAIMINYDTLLKLGKMALLNFNFLISLLFLKLDAKLVFFWDRVCLYVVLAVLKFAI